MYGVQHDVFTPGAAEADPLEDAVTLPEDFDADPDAALLEPALLADWEETLEPLLADDPLLELDELELELDELELLLLDDDELEDFELLELLLELDKLLLELEELELLLDLDELLLLFDDTDWLETLPDDCGNEFGQQGFSIMYNSSPSPSSSKSKRAM